VRFGIRPALKEDRRGSGQGLQAGRLAVTRAIIPDFGQQARGQPLSSAGQTAEKLAVSMGQKKVGNGLVILGNALHHWPQLFDQRQQQARLGASRDLVGLQVRLMQGLVDGGSDLSRIAVMPLAQRLLKLLHRRGQRGGRGGIRLQKGQGRRLLDLAEQLQGHRVIGFEAGRDLVDQTGLALDQTVLVAGQGFEFGNDGAIGFEAAQLGKIGAPDLGQQIGIDTIRLGSRGRPTPINRVGIDRVNGKSCFQQSRNEQAMISFDDASHLGFPLRATDGLQKVGQVAESFDRMLHLAFAHLLPGLIKDHDVVFFVSPVDASVPHGQAPSRASNVPGVASPSTVALEARLSNDRPSRNSGRRRTIFLKRSSRVEEPAFRLPSPIVHTSKHTLAPALCREGLKLV